MAFLSSIVYVCVSKYIGTTCSMHVMLLVCICTCETGYGGLEYVVFVCKTADCCAVPSACYRRHSCTPRDTPVLGQRPMLPQPPKSLNFSDTINCNFPTTPGAPLWRRPKRSRSRVSQDAFSSRVFHPVSAILRRLFKKLISKEHLI